MLALPEIGIGSSTGDPHQSDAVVVCDWIEGSLLFSDAQLSSSDICDVLCEQEVYQDQNEAMQFVDLVWQRLERRSRWLGAACSFEVSGRTLSRRGTWIEFLPNSFLLLLSFAEYFVPLRTKPVKGKTNIYIEQGEIFELFCKEALLKLGWATSVTGWSSGVGAKKLPQVVLLVAKELKEEHVNQGIVDKYAASNEEGCDLVGERQFPDRRGGRPVYLFQCASGTNWRDKRHTPSLDLWGQFVAFSQLPQRGFCLPGALEDDAFAESAHRIRGMLVDRYRLLCGSEINATWISPPLAARITAWCESNRLKLPML